MPSIDTDPHPDAAFKPGAAWVFKSFPRILAFGFGSGLIRPAPGTWGTLFGWLLWVVAVTHLPDVYIGVVLVAAFALGCWACQRAGKEMGRADYGGMVWDEVVAFWLVLWLAMPMGLWGQAVAFALFRFFDAAKPGPVAWADQLFKGFGWRGGWGILFDDFVAAFCTLLVIAVWRFFW